MIIKSIRKEDKFIPKFEKNRDLSESEQIVVNIKSFPTGAEAKSYKSYKFGDGGSIEVGYANDAVMLTRHIGGIKNIILPDHYEKVTNGSSLAKSKCLELEDLITEIREFLTEKAEVITEGES